MNQIFAALFKSKQFLKLSIKHGKIFAQRAGGPPVVVEYTPRGFYVVFIDNGLAYSSMEPRQIIAKLLRVSTHAV